MSANTMNQTHAIPEIELQRATQAKAVIAVDGPAASGKGTLARMLATRLGYAYLDTGALYRAVALTTLELGGDPMNFADVEPALAIVKRNLTPELLDNPELRGHEISEAASKVAAIPDVRFHLMEYQREFAKNPPGNVGGAVLDGRDIGTVICPDADVKFFVTATPETRARRRFEELKDKNPDMTYEKALADIQQRDQRDKSRKTAPMVAAEDASILDNTHLDRDQALEAAVTVIRQKFIEQSSAVSEE